MINKLRLFAQITIVFLILDFIADIIFLNAKRYIDYVTYAMLVLFILYFIFDIYLLKSIKKDTLGLIILILPFIIFIPVLIMALIFDMPTDKITFINIYAYVVSILTIVTCGYYLVKK